jgi:hypothetical protein
VFSALFLALQDAGKKELDPLTLRGFDQLWSLQVKDGRNKGAWPWFSLELEPMGDAGIGLLPFGSVYFAGGCQFWMSEWASPHRQLR